MPFEDAFLNERERHGQRRLSATQRQRDRFLSVHLKPREGIRVALSRQRSGALWFLSPRDRKVVEQFLDGGDLTQGVARVNCGQCQHEYLLACSCKGRYCCPSCHQKRVRQFGDWVPEQGLPPIPHRHIIPKILRIYFRTDRRLLGKLSQCAPECLKGFFQATLRRNSAVPEVMVASQTVGDLVNFHPPLHAIVSDGLVAPNGWVYV